MSTRYKIWKDGKIYTVCKDDEGMSRKTQKRNAEIVDWMTKDWINRKSKPYNPKIRKIYK